MSPGRVALAAGGTGGHVFPATALAEALLARGHRLALVTDRDDHAYGGALAGLERHSLGLSRMGADWLSRARGLAGVALAVPRARALLTRLRPDAVVGFGGYPALPTMFAACRAGIATAIHEQNAVLGRANRLLASRVDTIATAFADVAGMPARARALLVGNPVRAAVAAAPAYVAPSALEPLRLLVVGGSQGARVFTDVVPAALATLGEGQRARLAVAHQARPEDRMRARQAYGAIGVAAEIETFFADMPARLAAAHLVVCRAGASTCAELTAAGRPALLVPYPHATDDHQTANASALAAAGAAWLVRQPEFDAAALGARLVEWLADPAPLAVAADAARRLGRPDAAARLADLVERLMPANGGSARVAA